MRCGGMCCGVAWYNVVSQDEVRLDVIQWNAAQSVVQLGNAMQTIYRDIK